ncbi:unnamed protein product [Pseudo-nitzschia multistriata]|uniref:Uncharacterized protein n=1 Tax=Pseudo-nitzschia multistriata TaxID=183589 RepID=A0A448YWN6_9STRA|nr:unnamed protein product [Pseudo-nitzschia multistriata]
MSSYRIINRNTTQGNGGIIDEEDRPFFLRKIWCHGQSALPPLVAACFAVSVFRDRDSSGYLASPFGLVRFLLGIVLPVVLLCAWPFASWKAIAEGSNAAIVAGERRRHYRLLRRGGILVLAAYAWILAVVARSEGPSGGGGLRSGLGLLLAVFSALAIVETLAFLAVVTCLRSVFASL